MPLAALRDSKLVLPTIAHALGLPDSGSEPPLSRVIAYLRGKRLLLLVDNLEHLPAAAPALSDLLAGCPTLKLLTTSRTPLHLSGEQEFAVPPLALPDAEPPADAARLAESPAVALLLARLAAIAPHHALTEIDAPAIVEICRRTDGLPLAIELAAASSRYLTLQELAARLGQRLSLLTRGPRDLPPRQRTLRDTIAWSYGLLTPDEQRLLRRLTVFVGGWTLERAEELCSDEGSTSDATIDVVNGLAALVDSNLVRAGSGADGRTRYGMLETIREFAEEQLAASGEMEAIRDRHANVMLAFTDAAERGLQSGARTSWSRAAAEELDNVRAARRWSLDRDETECALRLVGNFDWYWDAVGRDREGWVWSQTALAKENVDRAGWGYARACYAAGQLAWNMGEFAFSLRLLDESISRFRALDDPRSLGQALVGRGLSLIYLGDLTTGEEAAAEGIVVLTAVDDPWNLGLAHFVHAEILATRDVAAARATYEKSLGLFRSIGEPWGIALAINGLGGLAMREHDYAGARVQMEEALALRRSIGNRGALAISLTSLGELARRQGDAASALTYLDEALPLMRDFGDTEHVAWALYNLGLLAIERGDVGAASSALAECLALRVRHGNPAKIAEAIGAFVRVALLLGEGKRAARLWGAVEAIRAAHDLPPPADEEGEVEQRTFHLIQSALDASALDAALAEGRALALNEAVGLASERN